MFDFQYLLSILSHKYDSEMLNNTVASLVKKGILEQYTDENGEFHFQITKFGIECAEEIVSNPDKFTDEIDEIDEMDD
tara:strand:+ start:1515 stop:1748 length:234 start_codon:yes stop_codon:yes gene_type:complete